jgi:hypothetical protein
VPSPIHFFCVDQSSSWRRFHSAFDEEEPDPKAPDRQSIEVRTIAFFSATAAEKNPTNGGAAAARL